MKCLYSRNQKSELKRAWNSRLLKDFPHQNPETRQSIIRWLLGDLEPIESLTTHQLKSAHKTIDYRYRILQRRYLEVNSTQIYRNLVNRLGSLIMLNIGVALSLERQKAVATVLQEFIQEILTSDRSMQVQMLKIAQCTQNPHLRNVLLLSSLEEYCLQPIRNQPRLLHKFLTFIYYQRTGKLLNLRDVV